MIRRVKRINESIYTDILYDLNKKDNNGEWHPVFGSDYMAIWKSNDKKINILVKKPPYRKNKWDFMVEVNGKIVSQDVLYANGDTLEEQMMDIAEIIKEMYLNPPTKKESKRSFMI